MVRKSYFFSVKWFLRINLPALISQGLEGSSSHTIVWMDDLNELNKEADEVLTF